MTISSPDWQAFSPVVVGCETTALTDAECALFAETRPLGLILFARNIAAPAELRALVAEFRSLVGNTSAPVLIDQEGGRVARLRPPHWPSFPAAAKIGALYADDPAGAEEAAYLCARGIGAELFKLGIDVDCAPVADLPVQGAHDVIGDRAYGFLPEIVSRLAAATMRGLLDAGVLPVVKHIPGHGRARSDSHMELPVVDADRATLEQSDFLPFRALNHAPWAMTAHILYPALDPDHPATSSPAIIQGIVRDTIGFEGVLISDDLTMKALQGPMAERGSRALKAGCDLVLHCSGQFDEMAGLLRALPRMAPSAASRIAKAAAQKSAAPKGFEAADRARFDSLMGLPPVQSAVG